MVVEDHDDLRSAIAEMLRYRGWTVREFARTEHALGAIRDEPPDVVLTDFNAGALSGPALARELRIHPATAKVPLVGMSGSVVPTFAMLRFFDLFLPKPVRLTELDGILRAATT